jgi:hypothetical protein
MAKTNDRVRITGAVSEGGIVHSANGDAVKLRWGQSVSLLIGNTVISGVKVRDDLAGYWTAEIPLSDATIVSLDADAAAVVKDSKGGWSVV